MLSDVIILRQCLEHQQLLLKEILIAHMPVQWEVHRSNDLSSVMGYVNWNLLCKRNEGSAITIVLNLDSAFRYARFSIILLFRNCVLVLILITEAELL